MKAPRKLSGAVFFVNLFIAVILSGAVLKIAAPVVIPIIIAIMLAFVFEPIVMVTNQKLKLPRLLAIIVLLLLFLSILTLSGSLLLSSLKSIIDQYPKYESRMLIIYEAIAKMFNLSFDENATLFYNLWGQGEVRRFVQNFAIDASNSILGFGKNVVIVLLFIYFLLMEMSVFQTKAEAAFADVLPEKIRSIISNIVVQITRYIFVKFTISLLTGVVVFFGTLAIGLDFPIIWGVLAFVLNFIPNFGSIISSALTAGFAILQFWPSPNQFLLTTIFMISIEFFLGNIIEPRIQGQNLGLSPFIIIVSLSVWGWLWGFSGLILAVPLMAIIKIICDSIDILEPFSIMLGNGKGLEKNVTPEK